MARSSPAPTPSSLIIDDSLEMNAARHSHYVPIWYQKRFLTEDSDRLHYLDLAPDSNRLSDGRLVTMNAESRRHPSKCFYQTDLYTTFFGPFINDQIERRLFGAIDSSGARAVRAFASDDPALWRHHFSNFFSYIDSQKTRTPKGLDWIQSQFPRLDQNELMLEMQAIHTMHCTIWAQGVREIVSAEASGTKFIVTDHPATVYNPACPPHCTDCTYPLDPSIALKGSRTIFPLDKNRCLILSNYEYVRDPGRQDPAEKRSHARFGTSTVVRTDALIRSRTLADHEVQQINVVLKSRAHRYIAAAEREWLFPEEHVTEDWAGIDSVLLPPATELYRFGGELYWGRKGGTTYFQDAFGRTAPENTYLKKPLPKKKLRPNEPCGCGSGRKFKRCCRHKKHNQRPSWNFKSIRERNLFLYNAVEKILGLNKDKTWDDVRRELTPDQVAEIHRVYAFLWPRDTDIYSLLPKPDGQCRALYTGMIDPTTIPGFALGSAPLFDEILIQQPFVNPAEVKPDFSPVHSPHLYRQHTLKNVFLLFVLMTYIDAGFVNFFPDPCVFDEHLLKQMMQMAQARSGDVRLDAAEEDILMGMARDDYHRAIRSMPRESQKKWLASTVQAMGEMAQGIHETLFEAILDLMQEQHQKDPFALLQDGDPHAKEGQLMIRSMAPNLEMSFVVAQATGSMLITDQPYRWKEITAARNIPTTRNANPWDHLAESISSLNYQLDANPETNFSNRSDGSYATVRNAFRRILQATTSESGPPNHEVVAHLEKAFLTSHQKADQTNQIPGSCPFEAKIACRIPHGGFVNKSAHRLLLTSGVESKLDSIPVALFISEA